MQHPDEATALPQLNADLHRRRRWRIPQLLITTCILALAWISAASPATAQHSGDTESDNTPLELTEEEQNWLDEHRTIRLGPYADDPPVEFIDANGRHSGIAADYIAIVEQLLGIQFIHVQSESWQDILDKARARDIDLMALAAETPDRLEYLSFTKPYLELPAVIIARDSITEKLTPRELNGMTVTVVEGWAVEEYLRSTYPSLTLDLVPDTATGLARVSFGSSDVFISDLAAASHAIEAEGFANLHIVGESGYIYRMGFASRNDWPIFNAILDKALAHISTAERQRIYTRWIRLDPSANAGASTIPWTTFIIIIGVIFLLILGTLWWNRSLARLVNQRTKDVEAELAERQRAEKELAQHRDQLEETVRQRTSELQDAKDDAESAQAMLEKYANELEQRNNELEEARAAAETANNAKSEFLANMSHEIRSPMTAILGYAEILFNEGDIDRAPPQRINAINTIRRNGHHLLNVINNILDLSKFEAGHMSAEMVECAPVSIAWDVIELMRVRAMSKGLTLDLSFAGPVPARIQTDPTRLRQILVNLVGNAIKFTSEGGVKVVVRMNDESKDSIAFDVVDHGIGISREHLSKLFRPFEQADTSMARRYGGTGLGLTISRRFADLLGGTINAVGAPGEGCTFTVTIGTGPLENTQMLTDPQLALDEYRTQRQHQAERDEHYADAVNGMRILLAEDTPDNQRLIGYHLSSGGANVTIVGNGAEAVKEALAARDEENPFDVILMDMQMPEVDGYEAAGMLREKNYDGPIIALTAHAMRGDRERCIEAGMDDYVTKPIDPIKLCATIRRAHDGSESDTKRIIVPDIKAIDAAVKDTVSSNNPGEDIIDATALMARVHGSHELLAELVELFIPECERLLAEIEDAVSKDDTDLINRLAHTIKGSISNFSASPARLAALELEEAARDGNTALCHVHLDELRIQVGRLLTALRNLGEPSS